MSALTLQNIISIFGNIKIIYPYAYKDMKKEELQILIDTWYEDLSDYSSELVASAYKEARKTCKMPPTIADIIDQINKIEEVADKSNIELWNELESALLKVRRLTGEMNYTYIEQNGKTQGENAKFKIITIYKDLDKRLKEYCPSVSTLISMADDYEDQNTYQKNNFFKLIPKYRERIKIKEKLPLFLCNNKILKEIE